MKPFCFAAMAAASLISVSTFAETVDKELIIKATVPSTLDWKQSDGTALNGTFEMKYVAGTGLNLPPIATKIHSNHPTANYDVSMLSDSVELRAGNGTKRSIPLTITLNNKPLGTTPVLLETTELFPNGVTPDKAGSKEMHLEITQTQPGVLIPGDYSTTINLVLAHTL